MEIFLIIKFYLTCTYEQDTFYQFDIIRSYSSENLIPRSDLYNLQKKRL